MEEFPTNLPNPHADYRNIGALIMLYVEEKMLFAVSFFSLL